LIELKFKAATFFYRVKIQMW